MAAQLSTSRRSARQAAFEALYACLVGGTPGREALPEACARQNLAPATAEFAESLAKGVLELRESLDAQIRPLLAQGWDIDRLAITDLIALRMGAFELLHLPEMPPKVTITECVWLAQRYGSAESARFVHGVLASLLKQSPKSDWTPPPGGTAEEEPETEEPEAEETLIEEGSPEHDEALKAGPWVVRKSDPTA